VIDYSFKFKPNIMNMNIQSATCSCSVELYKLWYTLVDFFAKLRHFAGFSLNTNNFAVYLCISAQCVFTMHVCNKNSLNIRREE
jgi:hypothetical protein